MQVNMTSLTSALTTALRQSTSSNSVFLAQDETQGAQGAGTSHTTATNSGNAVTSTGTGSSLLSSKTALDLIGQTQQVVASTTTSNTGGAAETSSTSSSTASSTSGNDQTNSTNTLPIALQHEMENVANDPAYAATVAQRMAGPYGVLIHINTQDPGDTTGWMERDDAAQATVSSLQPQLQALYQSDKAQGKSGAQTVADMLQLQLSQPQSYWAAMDPDHLQGDVKSTVQTQLTVLKQAMAKSAQSPSASSVTGQTT
jgi:hypothetical protein